LKRPRALFFVMERKSGKRKPSSEVTCSTRTQAQIDRALMFFADDGPKGSYDQIGTFRAIAGAYVHAANPQSEGVLCNEIDFLATKLEKARQFNPTYVGHMLSRTAIPAMLGDFVARITGSNTVAREVSLQESALEIEATRALLDIVGFDPKRASGTFTSGGTMANFTALLVARKLLEVKHGGEVDKIRVFTSPFAHYSVFKAIDALGGPKHAMEAVRVRQKGLRMDPADLDRKMVEACRDGIAMITMPIGGETETGLVDKLDEIASISWKYRSPMIVDAAYGAPYRLSRAGWKFDGMEKAFAVTLDVHKCLYTPYGGGWVGFRSARDHALIGNVHAEYVKFQPAETEEQRQRLARNFRRGEGQLGQKRYEGSMSAGAFLSTLEVMRTLGKDGLGTVLDLTLDRIDFLYQRLCKSDVFEPLHKPDLNLLCFAIRPELYHALRIRNDDGNRRVVEETRKELDNNILGKDGHFFSSTGIPTGPKGETTYSYRACIMHPRTTDEIVDNAVNGLEGLVKKRMTRTRFSGKSFSR